MSTNSYAQPKSTEVSFTQLQNRPVVYIRLNNSEPLLVILDTGLGRGLMLDDKVAKQLNLTALEQQTVDNLGMGMLNLQRYQSSEAIIGDFRFTIDSINGDENLPRMLNMMGEDAQGNRPVGVLSLWAFEDLVASIDLMNKTLSLATEQKLDSRADNVISYQQTQRLPLFPIEISQRSYTAHLDSGSPASLIMPYAMVNDFEYQVEPALKGKAMTAGRDHNIWTATLKGKVVFAGIELDDPEVLFMDGLPQINIGLAMFEQATIVVDTQNHLMEVIH